jgi:serine/threonine protein kinase/tetratricopeptide (TPR) repeat protein
MSGKNADDRQPEAHKFKPDADTQGTLGGNDATLWVNPTSNASTPSANESSGEKKPSVPSKESAQRSMDPAETIGPGDAPTDIPLSKIQAPSLPGGDSRDDSMVTLALEDKLGHPTKTDDSSATIELTGISRGSEAQSGFRNSSAETGELSYEELSRVTHNPRPSMPSVDSDTERIPKSVGAYSIERVLGRGGMGIVYKARHTKLGRQVALKMVLAGGHASKQLLQRFIAEAQAVAHLQHPNIVQIFEVGEHEGLPYFSLEYVNGSSLDKKIAGKPLPADEAARLMITLSDAMQYAHDHGVLHRDLKPANVMTTQDGVPKVTDFGLAKRLEESEDSGTTREGTVMGTPSYMAPEQARGAIAELGPATDQYSLGAMLYEFLTGRPPFMSPKPLETIMQVLNNEPIPLRQLQPKLPVDIETICLKALQKDASKRYASCKEFSEDLARFLKGEPIQARPVGNVEKVWRWYRRNPLVANLGLATAVGLIAVAGISTWSASVLRDKNTQLQEAQRATQVQADIAKQKEKLAVENEKKAIASEEVAERRAESVVKTVQDFYGLVNLINTNDVPKMKEPRDRMMKMLLPVLEREVLNEIPTDDQAMLTAAGLRMSVADSMIAQNMRESAEKIYLPLEEFFRKRAELKKTDAARANYLTILRPLVNLKRELARDMKASLELNKKQLAIAQDVWDNSRADEKGQGQYSGFRKLLLLGMAHHDISVTYYRIGNLSEAKKNSDEARKCYDNAIKGFDTDPWVAKLPESDKRIWLRDVKDAYTTTTLTYSAIAFKTKHQEEAEEILRQVTETAKQALEKDQNNASFLRDYCGKLGLLSEFLGQTGRTDEAIKGLEEAAVLGNRLLSLAPDHSEFQRTDALAQYRLCQWRRELNLADADVAGQRALTLRLDRYKLEPLNDRYRVELMLSEAQIGEVANVEKIATEYLEKTGLDNEMLIEVARALAQASARTEDVTKRDSLVTKALSAIQLAVEHDYRDGVHLTTELDFKPLRDNSKFQEIIKRIDTDGVEKI